MSELKHQQITGNIIGAAYSVHNLLGSGFLERVYRNALVIELRSLAFKVDVEKPIEVSYKGEIVGNYFADIVVDDRVIIEVKAIKELAPVHEVQLVNYLKATEIEVGLLINFGTSVHVKRCIMDKQVPATNKL
ncbi:MAG: hypothetical protein PWP14_1774 [Methanolobus sp.]|nr:hypothetical protein [Methanolobus sp.]